jgi:hypothetical protein
MCRIYFYKLTEDNGGAPCVTSDLLSLAICKPMIRKTAKEGDLIFGFGANSLEWVWQTNKKMKIGEPTNKPSRSVCHRSESCGVA